MSRTSRTWRSASQLASVSSADRPWCSPRPSALTRAGAIIAGSMTGTRSRNQAPSANRSVTSAATRRASRVLPTPPGPTTVTSRCSASACTSARCSSARPMNEVRVDGSEAEPLRGWALQSYGSAVAQGHGDRSERPPVAHAELAQQGRHVALDGSDRDEQAGADLGVGQVLAERGEHLCLARGDQHVSSRPRFDHTPDCPSRRGDRRALFTVVVTEFARPAQELSRRGRTVGRPAPYSMVKARWTRPNRIRQDTVSMHRVDARRGDGKPVAPRPPAIAMAADARLPMAGRDGLA